MNSDSKIAFHSPSLEDRRLGSKECAGRIQVPSRNGLKVLPCDGGGIRASLGERRCRCREKNEEDQSAGQEHERRLRLLECGRPDRTSLPAAMTTIGIGQRTERPAQPAAMLLGTSMTQGSPVVSTTDD